MNPLERLWRTEVGNFPIVIGRGGTSSWGLSREKRKIKSKGGAMFPEGKCIKEGES